ncbi:MAG TPA: hypothetical protein PKC97_14655 [Burkholderiaceae bacterium]|nr:hypothetical protein [Burkholderiaceae bacterium]
MQEPRSIANPFELMMNPEAVLQAIARSDRLERLQRRICRPLDKPVIARSDSGSKSIDGAIDAESDSEPDADDRVS